MTDEQLKQAAKDFATKEVTPFTTTPGKCVPDAPDLAQRIDEHERRKAEDKASSLERANTRRY